MRASQREKYNRFVFLLGSDNSVKNGRIQDALKQLNQRSVLDVETSQINQLVRTEGFNWPQLGGVTIRRFQIAVASCMNVSPQNSSEESKEFINEAVNDFREMFQNKRASLSEFHNLFFSAALTGLNRNEQASSWIKDHYQATRSPYWLARYAWVAEACGDRDLSTEILNGLELTEMSRSWLPMVANLRFRLGQTDTAISLLSSIENTEIIDLTLEELKVLYRARCLLGNRESSIKLYEKIKDLMRSSKVVDTELGNNQLMDLICFGVQNLDDGLSYFEKEFESLKSNSAATVG
jgi:tetratricopeptide (TPR) repeat protein